MTTSPTSTWQTIRGMSHNAPMRRALPLLLFVILCALVGCEDKKIVYTVRPKRYRAVISLSPSTTEIVASDGDISTLKGRTLACNFPTVALGNVPVVATVKPDYEKIQQIHPDLIVYDNGLYSEQDIDKLKSTKADMFAIKAQTVDGFIKELYTLGAMLAWETRFNDYIERIRTETISASASPFKTPPKVAILMPSPGGADYIDGTDSFLADVVRLSGGQLVGPKGDHFVPLNAEAFVALNPDVIVVNGSKADLTGPGLVVGDARFQTVTAVKNKAVRALDSDVLLRRGQRVDQLIKSIHIAINPS